MPSALAGPLILVLATFAGTTAAQPPAAPASGASSPSLAGIWVLDPQLTQRPSEIGFDRSFGPEGQEAESGRRGRRGRTGGSTGVPSISSESADDGTRIDQLTAEARTPPTRLTIVQTATSVSVTDDQGRARTFHPDGKLEDLTLGTVPLPTTARWDQGSLVVVYDVEKGRQLRYTYTPSANPTRLLVDIRFIEQRRDGDDVKLTYEPEGAHNREVLMQPSTPSASPSAAAPRAPAAVAGAEVPAAGTARPPVLRPGSELRGLTTIGTVVDDLTDQAAACGLDRAKIKTSIARILADAGFKTEPDGNEDSYVLLSVVTSKLPNGMCVSRYDASLVSQGDATFPYVRGLVSLPVQLLHEGGMTGSSPATHGTSVMDALRKSVNTFVSQIRAANK